MRIDNNKNFTEQVKFRLIKTPCCGQLLCWVNARLPNYCPECGSKIFALLRFDKERENFLYWDEEAQLSYKAEKF